MSDRFQTLSAQGITATLDLAIGHLVRIEVTRDGRTVAPLHRAPWADETEAPREADTAPNVMALGGDFLCAPFGANDVEPAPSHGWTANSAWRPTGQTDAGGGGVVATFELERKVFGATVTKELTLRHGHPFLYQRHVFSGGSGPITAAHHVNTRFPTHGRLDFSPKTHADIPDAPLETDPRRGRYVLAYPARAEDLSALPLASGGTVDLHRYPIGERHEDFVMLVEARGRSLGWTAALRDEERDLLIVLKDPSVLPVTLLWYSNRGRDYAPWNGRHAGVLGIEDARCWSLYGHRASIGPNPLADEGIPTCFELHPDGRVELRHVIGALPVPGGWRTTAEVETVANALHITSGEGESLHLPFDPPFLGKAPSANTP
jgi:hypothetical protein